MPFPYVPIAALSFVLIPLILWTWAVWTLRHDTPRRDKVFRVGMGVIVLIGVGLFLFVWGAGIALGFPSNVRHAYPSCGACHLAGSNGGGVLRPYGRLAGVPLQSTWAREGEELAAGFVETPAWAAIGGDVRTVTIATPDRYERLFMQADAELALRPVPGLWVVGSYGVYGREYVPEVRRMYALLELGDHVSARAGKFTPAYGINFPDHTTPTRAGLGLGQGRETWNAEATVKSSFGEATITGVGGAQGQVDLETSNGADFHTDRRHGVVGRVAGFVGQRAQLGLSGMRVSSVDSYLHAYGAHAIVGITDRVYVMAEADRKFEDGVAGDFAVGTAGVEAFKGFHLLASGTYAPRTPGGGVGIQWFPRPHFEIVAELRRAFSPYGRIDSAVMVLHQYL